MQLTAADLGLMFTACKWTGRGLAGTDRAIDAAGGFALLHLAKQIYSYWQHDEMTAETPFRLSASQPDDDQRASRLVEFNPDTAEHDLAYRTIANALVAWAARDIGADALREADEDARVDGLTGQQKREQIMWREQDFRRQADRATAIAQHIDRHVG